MARNDRPRDRSPERDRGGTAGDHEQYFAAIEADLEDALAVANEARERGGDPVPEVEIPVAQDMADRVENILGIDGVAQRVRELEGDRSREEAALALVEDFVDGAVGDYETSAGKIEGAVRTAVALLTEGVVAAPIEGIDRVEIHENDDGSEFVSVEYAGPIRSAGGTAQALSVLVADYARALLGIGAYEPRAEEIARYAEEIALYDDETGLQYAPGEAEARFIAEHLPIMLDGEATSDGEVEGYRDLERVDTNAARGGMCLVFGEGIALKAPKIQRYTRELSEVEWPWLQTLIDGDYAEDSDDTGETDDSDGTDDPEEIATEPDDADPVDRAPRAEPSKKFLSDLIAGRPVFSHPSEPGGFRLRYGRARNHGHATAGVSPATMHIVDDFLAAGTQIKTERPGKAAGVVPVDTIEGPTVRLANGEVRRIDDAAEALELRNGVERVLDLGEYLVNYGEFVENNHPLAPAGYTVEWWRQELAAAGAPVQALEDAPEIDLTNPTPERALAWADEDVPLHPEYTYLWHDVGVEQVCELAAAVEDGSVVEDRLVLEHTESVRETLEGLLVEHTQGERLVVEPWRPLVRTLGFAIREDGLDRDWAPAVLSERARAYEDGENAIRAINEIAPFAVRERAPTRVGARMGRPEKSEHRELSPAVHTLYPIGEAGGNQRSIEAAADHGDELDGTRGRVELELARRECPACDSQTYKGRCPECGEPTEPVYRCPECDRRVPPDESGRAECPSCERLAEPTQMTTVDINEALADALDVVGERSAAFDILKGVKGLSSAEKIPEPIEKGILRAKHGVSTFKDGTVRYDMTDLPVTAVRPQELDVSAGDLRELGYETDILGDPLRHDDQLVELKVQDVVLPDGAAEHLLQTAAFVDDLLAQYYGLDPYYEFEDRTDLLGELVFGMAPHTSAATVGRVIGFTSAAAGYAHPYFHAAKRRNCFHPATTIRYETADGLIEEPIETFVEKRLEDPRTDDFGVEIQELDGSVRVPSLRADGTESSKPVEAVSKHPAPDHLLRIGLASGRELTVTPDHSMLRWDGGLEEVPAHELAAGDAIPAAGPVAKAGVPERTADGGRPELTTVASVEIRPSEVEHTYSLTVEDTHRLVANGCHVGQCDGDEDCVMLLLDGLLNFSKKYLPDQRGGSVAEDARLVAIDPDGRVQFLTVAELWAELSAPIEIEGKFRKRTCAGSGWQTYAFDGDHAAAPQSIERAIRYPADEDERLLRVETQFGRTIEITAEHSLFRYDDGIEDVAGADLSPGDLVVAPRELPIDPEETTVDVASVLEDPHVLVDDRIEDLLRTAQGATGGGRSAAQSPVADRSDPAAIPYDRLAEQLDRAGLSVPPEAAIASPGAEDGIAGRLELDEDLAWLLGRFVAGGRLSGGRPTVRDADRRHIEAVVERGRRALGTEPRRRALDGAHEARFPAAFRAVLSDLGLDPSDRSGGEAAVPEPVRSAPRDRVRAFLRGVVAGADRSDEDSATIVCRTEHEDLADGLVYLLHRLGLVATRSRQADAPGRPVHEVTVPDTPAGESLSDILEGEVPTHPDGLLVPVPDALGALRELGIDGIDDLVPADLAQRDAMTIGDLRAIVDELEGRALPPEADAHLAKLRPLVEGDLAYLRVESVESVPYEGYLYDFQVGGEPVFAADWLYAHNSMDAPLVMSSRIDPAEIDDEAHNVDVMTEYPLAFYEATREQLSPDELNVEMELIEDSLGTPGEYEGFAHSHDTSDIAAGPDLSAYKTLGDMQEKMDAQLALSRRIRAVDETDVAERIIEYHFLPDLLGNLKAFASQEFRCRGCGTSYRRAPLTGTCPNCGDEVSLTVYEGAVTKYMDTAIRVAEEFGAREYTKQRLEILEQRIERLFEDDTNKQSGIADFM